MTGPLRHLLLLLLVPLAFSLPAAFAGVSYTGDVSPDPIANPWTSSTNGRVGDTSDGTLTVNGGYGLLSSSGYIGYASGATGTATISGAGSTWTNSHDLYVGQFGSGTLKISNAGSVSSANGYIGYYSRSTGTVTVNASTWTNGSDIYVSRYGSHGTLSIANAGSVSNTNGYIGYDSGSTGTVTVDASTWTNRSSLVVGYGGSGTLNIANGGFVSADTTHVAYQAGSSGTINFGPGGGTLTTRSLYYSSPSQLAGTGTIIARGLVSGRQSDVRCSAPHKSHHCDSQFVGPSDAQSRPEQGGRRR